MNEKIKAGDLVRITERKTKLQPNVKVGSVYNVAGVEKLPSTGATVLVLHHDKQAGKTMRVNQDRFNWERVELKVLAAEQAEAKFKQAVKTDVERILHAFTVKEHMFITFVPLILNEIAWNFAFKAIELGARDRVSDLRKLSRTLRELHQHYERVVCKDLRPQDLQRIQEQAVEFMQEHAYHFQIMYYTACNVFTKQFGKLPFEEMRVNAILAMAVIRYTDEHNKRSDDMLRARLGKIQAAVRMPVMDCLYKGMDAYTGELPEPFNFADTNMQISMGVMRNNLHNSEFLISDSDD